MSTVFFNFAIAEVTDYKKFCEWSGEGTKVWEGDALKGHPHFFEIGELIFYSPTPWAAQAVEIKPGLRYYLYTFCSEDTLPTTKPNTMGYDEYHENLDELIVDNDAEIVCAIREGHSGLAKASITYMQLGY